MEKGIEKNYLVPKIIKSFTNRDKTITLEDTSIMRDFIDVRDVARAYKLLSQSSYDFKSVNICSGVGVEIEEILNILIELTNHKTNYRI